MKKYLIALILVGLTTTSCYEKLNIAPPNQINGNQVSDLVEENPELVIGPMVSSLATGVLSGGGSVEHSDWATMNLCQNMRGNDFVYMPVTQSWHRGVYRFQDYRQQDGGPNALYWNNAGYAKITKANRPLNYLQDIYEGPDGNENQKTLMAYKATALTARAYHYMYLGWIYCDDYLVAGADSYGVPMYTKEDPYQDPQPRQTVEVLWKQFIIPDLQKAIQLYNWSGVGTTEATNDFDATVANAILAYAAITCGEWSTAINAAQAVIDQYPSLMDEVQYTGDADGDGENDLKGSGFTSVKMNPEVVFGFDATQAPGGGSSFIGWMNIYGDNNGYGGSATGYAAIDERLYDQMDDVDYRKKTFLTSDREYTYPVQKNTQTLLRLFNTKFATITPNVATPSKDMNSQDHIFFRTAEMILLKAEAEARSGNESAAKTTINTLVSARTNGAKTIDNYGPAAVQNMSLLEKIQLQWRIEMWGENGLEYYNNKRWNKSVDRVSAGPTGTASSHTDPSARIVVEAGKAFTWQIPVAEVNYNPDCAAKQNPY